MNERPGGTAAPSADVLAAVRPRVFINYRRDDSGGSARQLYDRLVARFGPDDVFLDVKSLQPGEEWLKEIRASGGRGGAFLALIGPHWLSNLAGRQAAKVADEFVHADYVLKEIEWALRDWPGEVIPVLLDTAMPDPSVLPRSIRSLTAKHAYNVQHASFDQDAEGLLDAIERYAVNAAAEGSADPAGEVGGRPEGRPGRRRTARTDDPPPEVRVPGPRHYREVADFLFDGSVVPIVGSHVYGAMPDAEALARYIAGALDLDDLSASGDLAEVAQVASIIKGSHSLHVKVLEGIEDRRPNPLHEFLATLPKRFEQQDGEPSYQLILTTNYDDALERAFRDAGEPFDLAVYRAQTGQFVHYPASGMDEGEPIVTPNVYSGFPIVLDDRGELELTRTVIVKLHGGMDGSSRRESTCDDYVLTEDQYIDYLPIGNIRSVVPIQILDKLRSSHNLFLGYRMRNWSERIFLRCLWHTYPLKEKSWAVLDAPDTFEQDGWRTYPSVDLFGVSLADYISNLAAELDGGDASPDT